MQMPVNLGDYECCWYLLLYATRNTTKRLSFVLERYEISTLGNAPQLCILLFFCHTMIDWMIMLMKSYEQSIFMSIDERKTDGQNRRKPSVGVEPTTLRLLSACSNQLSYEGGLSARGETNSYISLNTCLWNYLEDTGLLWAETYEYCCYLLSYTTPYTNTRLSFVSEIDRVITLGNALTPLCGWFFFCSYNGWRNDHVDEIIPAKYFHVNPRKIKYTKIEESLQWESNPRPYAY